jgi:predicted dehydrogenase
MPDTMKNVPFERHDVVRIGMIGVGGRGTSLLKDLLAVVDTRIVAVYDRDAGAVQRAQRLVTDAGQPKPVAYTADDAGFEALCERDDIDIVYVATPWDSHVPVAVAAMERGKHVALEVPAATTIADCWLLVDTSERTRRHCVMLENCCYGYNEMLIDRVVHAGLLGDITHGEAAYIHDLRELLLADEGEGLWRRGPHTSRDGNLYPTHGLGPVARYMDIHRGDRFSFLVSVSSKESSLSSYRDAHTPVDSPKRGERYVCGDINTSIIKTVGGRTIVLQHDVVTPRPADRINLIAGTKGTFRDYPARIFLDDDGSADGRQHGDWQSLDALRAEFEHPLWTQLAERAVDGGHEGIDFVMNFRLVECLREGLVPDIDVYDAAAWSAAGPLSEQSVEQGSAPVEFPDFTRGAWRAAAERD